MELDAKVAIPAWNDDADSIYQYLDLAEQVRKWLGEEMKKPTERVIDLGELLKGQPLTPATIDAMEESLLVQDGVGVSELVIDGIALKLTGSAVTTSIQYKKDDLKNLATKIAGTEDFSLTRSDWLAAQAKNWTKIFRYPAIFIACCFVVFLLLGREPKDTPEHEMKESK